MWALLFFYFYYWIGSTLEREWGTPRFNIFIFSGILMTVIYGLVVYFITRQDVNIGTYYIYLSMFFSFATLYPDMQVLFMYIIPIKMKYLAIVDAVFFALAVITNPFPVNLLPIVAVLNFFLFCGGDLLSHVRPNRTSRSTVNFRKESRRIRREQQS